MDDHRQRVVDHYRRLDEGPGPFRYFHFPDAGVDGHRYWIKAVEVDGQLVAIRQLEAAEETGARRYRWQQLDDAVGMLTDPPLLPDPKAEGLLEISAEDFERVWRAEETSA
jgi:hypothetical protein